MANQQRALFDTEPDPWEVDDGRSGSVASVVFVDGLAGQFDYLIPPELAHEVVAGKRLRVPLGRGDRLCLAYCVEVRGAQVISDRFKAVREVLDPIPLLSPAMLRLTRWIADYYLTSWGKVLEAVIPAGVRSQAGTRVQTICRLRPMANQVADEAKLPPKQAQVLQHLAAVGGELALSELQVVVPTTTGPIRSLEKRGLLELIRRRVETAEVVSPVREEPAANVLNVTQRLAVDAVLSALRRGQYETFLLHGVTGSGKTEVYITAIEEVIQYGRQAIVLVPEISLTPQTQRRFRSRFSHVAVLHSHLSDAERNWHWQRIARGEVQVVVGARSAIFAPVPHLGLIVLDEEHDGSFKQDSQPRYHARDVARERAAAESVPLVLGSATPSLESWQMTRSGQATLLSMPQRILDLPLPAVVVVDMTTEYREGTMRGALSQRLFQAIKLALANGEQVILLLNRRGYSTHIQCPACGHVVACPHCDIALTHHREGEKAMCHYCDYLREAPRRCPDCRFEGIQYSGLGSQRLEAEVRARFRDATVLRMDSDTMRRPGSHEEALNRFRSGEVQILVGTQMIAKGLDFPNVTVVGVVNADTALHLPDFRAAERTFQLITQVAGRTGRGPKGGRVFVQTRNPDHPAVIAAERHDYLRFAAGELPLREQHGYPPFGRMIRIIVRGPAEPRVQQLADEIARRVVLLQADLPELRVLGPAPAPMPKNRDQFRYHLIIQAADLTAVRAALSDLQSRLTLPEQTLWQADIDPQDML